MMMSQASGDQDSIFCSHKPTRRRQHVRANDQSDPDDAAGCPGSTPSDLNMSMADFRSSASSESGDTLGKRSGQRSVGGCQRCQDIVGDGDGLNTAGASVVEGSEARRKRTSSDGKCATTKTTVMAWKCVPKVLSLFSTEGHLFLIDPALRHSPSFPPGLPPSPVPVRFRGSHRPPPSPTLSQSCPIVL